MRYPVTLMIILVFALAACGGDDDSAGGPIQTPTVDIESLGPEAATFQAQMDDVLRDETPVPLIPTVTPAGENALPVPQPGTLVASETEDPEPHGMFDYIRMEQEGGRDHTTTIVEIYNDGRVIRNGVASTVGVEDILELDEMVNTLNFFGMQGTLMGLPGGADSYTYRVFVQRGFQERTINAQDGYMPDEFMRFLGLIRRAGDTVNQ